MYDGKVLLMTMRRTGKYHPPGGGINAGESVKDALKREVREEAGIEVEIERFARIEESFFYHDPSRTAYHGMNLYYVCRPETFSLLDDSDVEDDAVGEPQWVDIEGLPPQDFTIHGEIVFDLCEEVATQLAG